MTEVWKEINEYENLYEVSNLGRVRSLDRIIIQSNNRGQCKHLYKGKILALHKRNNGYLCTHLSKNGIAKWLSVHRLVAETFIPHIEENNIVNHLDNNRQNNRADNLEWTTFKGNMQWASKQGRMKYNAENLKKAQKSKRIPVIAIDKYGNEFEFESQAEAAKKLNCNRNHIGCICKNKYGYKTSNGYSFKYKEV